jgi:hypothetical protein
VYDRVSHLETTHDVWLNLCNTYGALLKLSHLVRTPIIDSIKLLLRNLVNRLMIDLLGLSRL